MLCRCSAKEASVEGVIFLTATLVEEGRERREGRRITPQWSDLPRGV
jgi:hypothetical protein